MAQALPEEVSSSLAGLQLADNEPRTAPAPASAAAAAESEQPEQPPEQPPDSSAQSQMVPAKFLMSNSAAGACIGKGGETITKIQAESEARLQLSRANEYFPGTNDRILLISGPLRVVIAGLHFVLLKIEEEQNVRQTMLSKDGDKLTLRMLVPVPLCGCIIGKGGQVIRGIMDDSKATISVSSQEKHPQGLPDRVVKMSGERDQLMRATAQLLQKLMENARFSLFMNSTVNYELQQPRGFPGQPMAAFPGPASLGPPLGTDGGLPQTEQTIPVPESRVGAIIGKGGEVINNLKSVVGVRIRVSNREDYFPGTRDRKVTITGAPEAVRIAQGLIAMKVAAAGPGQ